ncbi:phage portal protein [Lactobacillus sp. UCMA15818]|uniref:phage portal protein n=1 Tax=Lactobacillus sp. UCMA15818 TaxID=2583394 RepID=UPI0025AF9143|nr:phage portal protein [Lactobacillus sp. UCMA15818]MDN2452531.1 phage portal protein [Lactobacillus sp. UCMA15818]
MITIKFKWDLEQANLIYQEDLDKLTPDRIMKFITHHFNFQRPRLQILNNYYQGFNTAIFDNKKRRHEDGKADYRASHSFAKYIADFQTSYSVGNPINVKLPIKNDERFAEITQANDIDALNYDLFLDMTRYGRAFEYIYRGTDDVEHIVRLDPLDTFIIYSLDVDPQPIMAVRYHQVEIVDDNEVSKINYIPETWTESEHIIYKSTPIDGVMNADGKTESIVSFPVVEYWNNKFRLGDYENVISLIDLYDAAESDTANYMTDLNEAMLVIKGDIDTLLDGSTLMQGVDPTDKDAMAKLARDKLDILKEMKSANLLLLKSGVTATGTQTNVDAGYIHKEYDVNGTEAYKKRLASDIHKFSHTPDLTDENFASNVSGVAMKYKLLGTVELAATKRRLFERGLYTRYQIIATLESKASSSMKNDPNELVFTFKDNLPTDDIAQIQQLQSAGATLPQEYLYQFLPGVTDPSDITEMMQKQQEEQQEYQLGGGSDESGRTEQDNSEVRGQSIQQGPEQPTDTHDN